MKSCLKNVKRNPREKNSSNYIHATLCSEMEIEVNSIRAKAPNMKKLKDLLSKTRLERQRNVNKISASTFLMTYPALKISDLV